LGSDSPPSPAIRSPVCAHPCLSGSSPASTVPKSHPLPDSLWDTFAKTRNIYQNCSTCNTLLRSSATHFSPQCKTVFACVSLSQEWGRSVVKGNCAVVCRAGAEKVVWWEIQNGFLNLSLRLMTGSGSMYGRVATGPSANLIKGTLVYGGSLGLGSGVYSSSYRLDVVVAFCWW
jgi:hypothetical protein